MTALAQALREAGVVPADERLMQIAIEAWGKWPKADAGGARRDFVTGKLTGEMEGEIEKAIGTAASRLSIAKDRLDGYVRELWSALMPPSTVTGD